MILMVCVDDRGGMLFNHRRQSQDRVLRAQLLQTVGDAPLLVNAYTARQFSPEEQSRLRVLENPLDEAGCGEYCFWESSSPAPWEDRMEALILWKWNRVYPGDVFLGIPLADHGWTLTETREFPGSSHEKITMEVYRRCSD